MLAVHRIFQMIFGIIVSVMILYFLITYSGNYSNTQKSLQRGEILNAFAGDVRNVYLTGIPVNFTYFSMYDFSSCYMKYQERDIPRIMCSGSGFPEVPIETPVIFYPGKQIYIGRDSLDYGWWVSGFAEAIPSMTFVFNPLENTDEVHEVVQNIVEHLPDTSDDWSTVKVDFAVCSGSDISYPCGGACGKLDFLGILPVYSASTCTASLKKNMRLVTISSSCSYLSAKDVCISPPPNSNGVGNAYIKGSVRPFVWKDPLDLVALSVGGSEKDEFGKAMGEKIFDYKNALLMERLLFAAELMSRRNQLVTQNMPLPDETGCYDTYAGLFQTLDGISSINDYADVSEMNALNSKLNQAKDLYQQLEDKGCERGEYGL